MKRNIVLIGLVLVCSWWLALPSAMAGSEQNACALYTRADAESLFQQTVSEGVPKTTMFPAGQSCRYSFTEKGDNYGITVRISTSAAIKEEGINDSADDVMTRQKKARKAGGHAAKTFLAVSGLGDDAFWNGSDLWVLRGDMLLIIQVHSVLEGSFKNMQEARQAGEKQNLVLSRKAAQTVLSRLK